jgi:hypothetical protein
MVLSTKSIANHGEGMTNHMDLKDKRVSFDLYNC